jgi:glycosyltransferase involved in cell wall biosynthesis
MSVYHKEIPENLVISVESMFKQTVLPDEFLLIEDGYIPDDLKKKICELQQKYPNLHVHSLQKNVGAGLASRYGIPLCKNEYIARMDSDDYSVPTRIQEEFDAMFEHHVDMVGCVIDEFVGDTTNVVAHRMLPENDADIRRFSRARSPIAHSAVLYKKSQVLACGSYEKFRIAEDMIVFAKMLKQGAKAYNIQHPLVYMRVSTNFFKRRGGFRYFCKIMQTNLFLVACVKWMPLHIFAIRSAALSFSCFAPNFLREFFYKKILRK